MKKDWAMVPLDELLTKYEEWTEIEPTKRYRQVTVRLWGQGVVQRNVVDGSEIAAKRQRVARAGQFIMSKIDARNGAFGLVPESLNGAVVSADFPVFTIDPSRLMPKFLEWMSKTRWFIDRCFAVSEGTTYRVRLKERQFLRLQIPLPPLSEQRRIVARVDKLAAKVKVARGLRQQAAEEAEALLNSQLSVIFNRLLEKNGSHKLDDLIVEAGYGTSTKCEYERLENSAPVLRVPNVASEKVNFDDMKYGILSNAELERVLVNEGDILVVRTNGSANLVARCAVVPTLSEPTAFASYLIRLRCDRQIISPDYLQLMLKHLRTSGQLFNLARTTAGQYNVSLGRLRSAKIPIPSLPEQRRIVVYLDDLQAKVGALKGFQGETAAELDALLSSILDKAFKGEL